MTNLLKKIFTPNWVLIDSFYGSTFSYKYGTRREHDSGVLRKIETQNIFKIMYSKIRNEYKIEYTNCYDVSSDPAYQKALSKLAEYNKSLIH